MGPMTLQDSYGRPIDAGRNDTAVLRRGGTTITAAVSGPTIPRRELKSSAMAVDVLLEREDKVGWRHEALQPDGSL
jgi:hypothetical protein